jgi:hypothetical protein
MPPVKNWVAAFFLTGIFAMSGCASTLFFPAKPAEKAADKVIDDIWPVQGKPADATVEPKKS